MACFFIFEQTHYASILNLRQIEALQKALAYATLTARLK